MMITVVQSKEILTLSLGLFPLHAVSPLIVYLCKYSVHLPPPPRVLVDVEVLSGALELSREVLLQDPCQLASQLTGRLGQMVMEDRPVAKGTL